MLQIQPIHELLKTNDRGEWNPTFEELRRIDGEWNPTFEELRRIDEVLQGIEKETREREDLEVIWEPVLPSTPRDPSPNFFTCASSLLGCIFWIWLFRAIRGGGGSGHGGPHSPPLQALDGAHSPQGRRSTGSGSGLPDTLRITRR